MNGVRFQLVDADDYTLGYMELHSDEVCLLEEHVRIFTIVQSYFVGFFVYFSLSSSV